MSNDKKISSKYKEKMIVMMGDFNYKHINWNDMSIGSTETSDNEIEFLTTIKDCYLTQHVSQMTRGRGQNKPNLLDLVITNEEHCIEDIQHLSLIHS